MMRLFLSGSVLSECGRRLTRRCRPGRAVSLAAIVLVAMGCGTVVREDTAALAGRVTIDGKPVALGGIQFMPLEKGRPAFAEVRDGLYVARVPKGRVRAIFSSRRETGRQVEVYSTTMPEVIDALPASLREGIEITVEGDDPNRDFVLSGKAAGEGSPR
jgi:hypothetical protein